MVILPENNFDNSRYASITEKIKLMGPSYTPEPIHRCNAYNLNFSINTLKHAGP